MAEILGRRFKRWETPASDAGQAEFVEDGMAAYEAVESAGERLMAAERGEGYSVAGIVADADGVILADGGESPHSASGHPLPEGEAIALVAVDGAGAPPVQLAAVEGRHNVSDIFEDEDGADADEDDGLLGWGALPDLVIVDGGKGQLSAALDVMRNLGLQHVPLAGLAKQNEELFVQDQSEPIVLPRTSQSLYLVQRIRDEAHRFAITYHRKVRAKTGMESALDSVPGIGPKRKRALLRKFGSLAACARRPWRILRRHWASRWRWRRRSRNTCKARGRQCSCRLFRPAWGRVWPPSAHARMKDGRVWRKLTAALSPLTSSGHAW